MPYISWPDEFNKLRGLMFILRVSNSRSMYLYYATKVNKCMKLLERATQRYTQQER